MWKILIATQRSLRPEPIWAFTVMAASGTVDISLLAIFHQSENWMMIGEILGDISGSRVFRSDILTSDLDSEKINFGCFWFMSSAEVIENIKVFGFANGDWDFALRVFFLSRYFLDFEIVFVGVL